MATIQLTGQGHKVWPQLPQNATDIRIEKNNLTSIPDSVGSLKNLTRIIASNNKINDISNELSKLERFTDLRLASNSLSIIPNEVFNLTKLQILILNDNKIKSLDGSIYRLNGLVQLHLHNNELSSVPENIGELSELTHLILNNNPIEYLPHSILKCKKLIHLELSNTKLPLPANCKPNQVQEIIKYVIENQKEQEPELLIKKAYVFKNLSKESLIEKYETIFKDYSLELGVEFEEIVDLESINNSTTVVIIVVGFDVHDNKDLVFEIIEQCQSQKVPCKILYQKDIDSVDDIHVEKGHEIMFTRNIFENDFKDEINLFKKKDELKGLILNVLQQHSPELRLISLELENIGHFKKENIVFDDKLTCLVGENGQGKSSILRALAVAIVGVNNAKVSNLSTISDLLRIKSITKDDKIIRCDSGRIRLKYSLDSNECQNDIQIISKDEGRVIDLVQDGDFELNTGEYNLKTLIVGFPQLRGKISQSEDSKRYSQAHIDDLIPLINNTDDLRLDSFINWITNLYGEAIKSERIEETRELRTIEYVFEVISDLTGRRMSFLTVQQFSPPIVIVTSEESPNGIPLNLISQGFKIVVGWIGYFIQRKIEAFPLASPKASAGEKSILIIDEIDSSIHPVWQARLLFVLRENFPNTQIICTTHSPLMIAGLDRGQIIEVKTAGGESSVGPSTFDTWVTTYQEILRNIFNTKEHTPVKTVKELERQLIENEDNDEKKSEIYESIDRLKESELLVDQLSAFEVRLKEREAELERLIAEYSMKVST